MTVRAGLTMTVGGHGTGWDRQQNRGGNIKDTQKQKGGNRKGTKKQEGQIGAIGKNRRNKRGYE